MRMSTLMRVPHVCAQLRDWLGAAARAVTIRFNRPGQRKFNMTLVKYGRLGDMATWCDRATCAIRPPGWYGHLCNLGTCAIRPPVQYGHLRDTVSCAIWPHMGHLYNTATCAIWPPAQYGHLRATYTIRPTQRIDREATLAALGAAVAEQLGVAAVVLAREGGGKKEPRLEALPPETPICAAERVLFL